MYQQGEYIIYGSYGVCKVADVGRLEQGPVDPGKTYYTLKPLFDAGVLYTPVDTGVFMRPVITRKRAEELVMQIPFIREDVCTEPKGSFLRDHYETSFHSHDCEDLVKLIKTVSLKSQKAQERGKRLGQMDERYRKRAEELLYGELSVALDIPRKDVVGYIETAAKNMEETMDQREGV